MLAIHHKLSRAAVVLAVAFFLVVSTIGCGNSLPDVVPVTGTITLNGEPLPHARVRFYPDLDNMGGAIARGLTDDAGHFSLQLPGKPDPGAYVGECKVTVSEGPIPDEIREGTNAQAAGGDFRNSLPNRPIPKDYSRVGQTSLRATVSAENDAYDFELER